MTCARFIVTAFTFRGINYVGSVKVGVNKVVEIEK